MMDFTWYVLGFLSAGSAYLLYELSKKYRFDWMAWTGSVLGIFLILFCIAWFAGTTLEGVPRAASMGIVFFFIPCIVLLTLTVRLILSKNKKSS